MNTFYYYLLPDDINYSYHFDTTPPEPDPEPAVESTPPPALEPSGETTPAVSATQPSETCDVMQPQEPEPSQPKPRIPHVDRSAKVGIIQVIDFTLVKICNKNIRRFYILRLLDITMDCILTNRLICLCS